jgi:putative ATP-dependent endonuclease of OLD family
MLINKIKISNFRSIQSTEIDLSKTTVLIGPNNAGKTAILEAIRIALTRRWGQRGTGFTEYDIHLNDGRTDPKVGDPVTIEAELSESQPNEWPEELHQDLDDIIQLNPITGTASIILKVTCGWDAGEESYIPKWEFLNIEKKPLTGRGARAVNFQEFFKYIPVFYLEALRDAGDEFSARSQFWGRLLKSVQIPEALEKRSQRVFDLLNQKLLKADPKLNDLAEGLSNISSIAAADLPGKADLRVLPLNPWDLLSKAEVIYQSESNKPWLPLLRHGQGVQSLSVMFLFKSFIELLITQLYPSGSEAVLALEEPETHLHPQAARTLWKHISELPGQKIVTTHSPYFLQHVPFRDIRVVRSGANGTTISYLPRDYRAHLPYVPAIDAIIAASGGKLSYDRGSNQLICFGTLDQKEFRELLVVYHGREDTAQSHAALRKLLNSSICYLPDDELDQLETFARRIRGEIFFARRWLLVEGPTDYNLMHGVATALNYNLDEHGVAVIDFQNNGNPACFAALARALGYPWVMFVDGDDAGKKYITSLESRGFQRAELDEKTFMLPAGCIEQQLVADGLQPELKTILKMLGVPEVDGMDDTMLIFALENNKSAYSSILAKQCAENVALAERMPEALRSAIQKLQGLE